MKYCLWCLNVIHLEIDWNSVLFPPERVSLCVRCYSKLKYLPSRGCCLCHRESTKEICYDCERWKVFYNGTDPLLKNVSVFQYNDFLQEVITKWKYRGDYLLGEIFRSELKSAYIQKLQPILPKDSLVLPIPLSSERSYDRAFNQARQLASFLPLNKSMQMSRSSGEKQSKRTREERLSVINPFILQEPINKTILLVDDLYTTGRTLRHAAELLVAFGARDVYALTLARG